MADLGAPSWFTPSLDSFRHPHRHTLRLPCPQWEDLRRTNARRHSPTHPGEVRTYFINLSGAQLSRQKMPPGLVSIRSKRSVLMTTRTMTIDSATWRKNSSGAMSIL